jgi:hypothetical protein
MLVALAGDETLRGKPTSVPRIEVLSAVEIGRLATYDGPTWLDEAIIGRLQVQKDTRGLPTELRQALVDRGRWLAGQGLAAASGSGEVVPKADMMRSLRQRETTHLAETLSRQLNAIHVPRETGSRISGVYEHAIMTPTGRLAVIRSTDTFTLAPWKPALEPLRGRAVLGLVGPSRVMWTLDRAARCLDGGKQSGWQPPRGHVHWRCARGRMVSGCGGAGSGRGSGDEAAMISVQEPGFGRTWHGARGVVAKEEQRHAFDSGVRLRVDRLLSQRLQQAERVGGVRPESSVVVS